MFLTFSLSVFLRMLYVVYFSRRRGIIQKNIVYFYSLMYVCAVTVIGLWPVQSACELTLIELTCIIL